MQGMRGAWSDSLGRTFAIAPNGKAGWSGMAISGSVIASDLHLMHLAKRTVQSLYKEAQGWIKKLADERPAELIGEEADNYNTFVRKATGLLSWAHKSEDSIRLHAMIKASAVRAGCALSATALDQEKYLLNVENGTLDLHSGQLREPCRGDYITRTAPVTYDPHAACPNWLAFLKRIMAENQEILPFLQQAAGYALTGSTQEQVFYLLYGTGANGKSTYLETLQEVMGDYALQVAPETLLIKKNDGIPNDLARCRRAFVAAIETEDGKRLAEARVKQLTGGDKVSARFLFAEWFDFKPEFKLFLATNHKPNVRGTDLAIWRRVRFIPSPSRFLMLSKTKSFLRNCMLNAPGSSTGCWPAVSDWQARGHMPPERVQEATKAYQHEQDALQTFLDDECITTHPRARVTVAQFYKVYKEWAERITNTSPANANSAKRWVRRIRTYRRGRRKMRWVWEGLGLLGRPPGSGDGIEA